MSEQSDIYIQRRMFRDVQGALLNQHAHMKDGRIQEEPVLPFDIQPITVPTMQRLQAHASGEVQPHHRMPLPFTDGVNAVQALQRQMTSLQQSIEGQPRDVYGLAAVAQIKRLGIIKQLIVEDLADAYSFSYETEHSMTAPSATGTAR